MDSQGRVLLFRGGDPARPAAGTSWFTPGGEIDHGESLEEAARRELREETGLLIGEVGPVVLNRRVEFEVEGVRFDQVEHYFLVVLDHEYTVADDGWTDLERRIVAEHRWWTVDDLRATPDRVFPDGLLDLLDRHGISHGRSE